MNNLTIRLIQARESTYWCKNVRQARLNVLEKGSFALSNVKVEGSLNSPKWGRAAVWSRATALLINYWVTAVRSRRYLDRFLCFHCVPLLLRRFGPTLDREPADFQLWGPDNIWILLRCRVKRRPLRAVCSPDNHTAAGNRDAELNSSFTFSKLFKSCQESNADFFLLCWEISVSYVFDAVFTLLLDSSSR